MVTVAASKRKLGVAIFLGIERLIRRHSLVGSRRFYDPADFPWAGKLEAAHRDITSELQNILRVRDAIPNFQEISIEQAAITQENSWKTFFLLAYGRKIKANLALCPKTAAALADIPGVMTAFFSILMPQKLIPPHRGPYAGVVRYHLALLVPKPETLCGITVGGETAHWIAGKSLFFDDTYLHRAWNHSDEIRVILFVDLMRPLAFPYSLLNYFVMKLIALSPLISASAKRLQSLDKIFQEAYRNADK